MITGYTSQERKVFITGVIIFLIGFLSSIITEERYGNYYFDNGVRTLLKR